MPCASNPLDGEAACDGFAMVDSDVTIPTPETSDGDTWKRKISCLYL
jgi:hypothetical protein